MSYDWPCNRRGWEHILLLLHDLAFLAAFTRYPSAIQSYSSFDQ